MKSFLIFILSLAVIAAALCLMAAVALASINTLAEAANTQFYIPHNADTYFAMVFLITLFTWPTINSSKE